MQPIPPKKNFNLLKAIDDQLDHPQPTKHVNLDHMKKRGRPQ